MKRIREEIEVVQKVRRELEASLRQERQRYVQRESELNEQCMMERLKYSEAMQSVQDLRQTITQLELRKAEGWTQNQLRGSSVCEVDDDSTSHLSIGSNADVFSLGSDDMNALVTDMTFKVPLLMVSTRKAPLQRPRKIDQRKYTLVTMLGTLVCTNRSLSLVLVVNSSPFFPDVQLVN